MRIFVAGPYGDTNPKKVIAENVRVADEIGRALMALGHQVFVPHKMAWGWEDDSRITLQACIDQGLGFLRLWAEALYRIPGYSKGADGEVAEAERLGLPVFTSMDNIANGPGRAYDA